MKNFKLFIILNIIIITLNSCGTIKEGFSSQKKNNNDEFLVEKKSPLLMPPDYDELPVPQSENISKNNAEENELKKLLTKTDSQSPSTNELKNSAGTLEETLLKKIKDK